MGRPAGPDYKSNQVPFVDSTTANCHMSRQKAKLMDLLIRKEKDLLIFPAHAAGLAL